MINLLYKNLESDQYSASTYKMLSKIIENLRSNPTSH